MEDLNLCLFMYIYDIVVLKISETVFIVVLLHFAMFSSSHVSNVHSRHVTVHLLTQF